MTNLNKTMLRMRTVSLIIITLLLVVEGNNTIGQEEFMTGCIESRISR